jgi:hypothetical protein
MEVSAASPATIKTVQAAPPLSIVFAVPSAPTLFLWQGTAVIVRILLERPEDSTDRADRQTARRDHLFDKSSQR